MAYINIQFPLADDDIKGYFLKRTTTSDAAIKSDLTFLLITEKGTRKYFRDFGTNLKKYLFDQNDTQTEFDIDNEIKTTVSKYLPTVVITKVTFQDAPDNINAKDVIVEYQITEDFFTTTDILAIRFNSPS